MEDRPSDRHHLIVVAGVTLVAAVVLAVWLGTSERRVAATNSIAAGAWAAKVDAGSRLCVARQWMAAGADTVRARLAPTGGSRATVVLRIATPEGARVSSGRVARASGEDVDFHVRPVTRDTWVSLCLRPSAGIRVAGLRDADVPGYDWRTFTATDPSPVTRDGKRVDARISLWFLEPESRSLAATVPDVARRAATFRPGFVAGWTYVLLLGVLAIMWVAALRLLRRDQ